jgi:hypothetical protein
MPLQATSGAASYDGFGGGVAAVPNYIEDVFSTYLWTGTGSSQTINNGIDLSTKGGLVWIKPRASATNKSNSLWDTLRGATTYVSSNLTNGNISEPQGLTAFNSNGFTIGTNTTVNESGYGVASWTFRKQPKFFDVVTYTGDGTLASRLINHSLGSVPACIIIKRTDTTSDWVVSHRGTTFPMFLQSTAAAASANRNNGYPELSRATSTQFDISDGASGVSNVNASGGTYVAYLFAHNAGGFGLTGTDNVISCGSLTMDGSGNPASVTLGYEPQMVIVKRTDSTSNWYIEDNMRGLPVTGNGAQLYANTSGAEAAQNIAYPNATGFTWNIGIPSATYIYIAIRRGPMKVPTSGTSVFDVQGYTGAPNKAITTGFPSSLVIERGKNLVGDTWVFDRLRGGTASNWVYLKTNDTTAESTGSGAGISFATNTGYVNNWDTSGSIISWAFQRAPSFFDEVCYTGTGSARTINHNLGVAPEMMIVKVRGANSGSWRVYHSALGPTKLATLNLTNAAATLSTIWNDTAPTSSVFTVGTYGEVNLSGDTFVAYLFATCAGVSKVGSYTGTGTTLQVNCGFTGGARFVLIKRTDSTGDWYVWDTARGIVTANDPHLSLNTTAAEVTTDDTIDTDSTGFVVNQVTATNVNVSSATYIFLAIA